MGEHGFASNMDFHMEAVGDGFVEFMLASDSETLEIYPFEFELYVKYELKGATLFTTYKVENKSAGNIYFSIGGHPGFNCVLGDTLKFEHKETLSTELLNENALCYKKIPYLKNEDTIKITKDVFANDALIFEGLKSSYVVLNTERYKLKFTFGNVPFLGLWAKPGAEYVCIEPWFGINDSLGADVELSKKRGIVKLSHGDVFKYTYAVEFVEKLV